ncbi:unnamed protein product [Allacma fusca]|uniref:Uncharacterized protein n=1 Tax=Allacma fusca TaxID=39272 RepID=A0A8J2PI78_9HEXA|nr:unnamed protein product [Allacma fusca]
MEVVITEVAEVVEETVDIEDITGMESRSTTDDAEPPRSIWRNPALSPGFLNLEQAEMSFLHIFKYYSVGIFRTLNPPPSPVD